MTHDFDYIKKSIIDPRLHDLAHLLPQMSQVVDHAIESSDLESLHNYTFSIFKKATQFISSMSEITYALPPVSNDSLYCDGTRAENPDVSVRFGTNNNILVVNTPLPAGRMLKSSRGAFAYRAVLQQEMAKQRQHLGVFPRTNTMFLLFSVGSMPASLVKDHDNYFTKPIIDTITNGLGISDSGLDLPTAYFTTRDPALGAGLYVLVIPAEQFPQPCEAITICLNAKWL